MVLAVLLTLAGCVGAAPRSEPLDPDPAPLEAPVPASPLATPLHVPLPYGRAVAIPELSGEVTLLSASSSHGGDRLETETSSGTLRLSRGGAMEEHAWVPGQVFEAWGLRMAVFGASGSYELGIFPEGAAVEP